MKIQWVLQMFFFFWGCQNSHQILSQNLLITKCCWCELIIFVCELQFWINKLVFVVFTKSNKQTNKKFTKKFHKKKTKKINKLMFRVFTHTRWSPICLINNHNNNLFPPTLLMMMIIIMKMAFDSSTLFPSKNGL